MIYLILALCSGIENLFPPFPGDTVTVFGAYVAGFGLLGPYKVFFSTAAGNLVTNVLVYHLGRTRGRAFIIKHPHLFKQRLLPRVALLYRRWGLGLIFFSRALVGIRIMVPLFAGISRFRFRNFFFPIVVSIAIQHGLLVYLGYAVGQNWESIKRILRDVNLSLTAVGVIMALAVLIWWWRSGRESMKKRRERKAEKPLDNQGGKLP